MFNGISWRDPILINTIGHSAGVLLFGFIIALLIRDRRAHGIRQTKLSIGAAALALSWNIGSLSALASQGRPVLIAIVMTASFSVLSLLPALLLQVALQGEQRALIVTGYAVSAVAILCHLSEVFAPSAAPHQWGLVAIAVGFGALTILAFLLRRRDKSNQQDQRIEWFSLAALFLFTTSFLHFGYRHSDSPWAAEIAWHHIGIPVALIVLLQDYRFLLLDAFVRFLLNSGLAAAYAASILLISQRFHVWRAIEPSAFLTGLTLVFLCLSLVGFAHVRNLLQHSVRQMIFGRQDLEDRIRRMNQLSSETESEDELMSRAAQEVAQHLRTDQFAVVPSSDGQPKPDRPTVLFGGQHVAQRRAEFGWAEAQIPLYFSSGEVRFLLTGPRRGRQRYLSEDLEEMRRLGSVIVEQVERFRSEELKRLATEAELRALQAQINPHFLFNALNTLYGSIDRGSVRARRMVLNLAEIFRYFLRAEGPFIALAEEVRIVQAYLEIEALRLGDRLETKLDVDESARAVMIPTLSIQPLVENAVKHGIAPKQGPGRITLRVRTAGDRLCVSVEDTGSGFSSGKQSPGSTGVGLDNVRRRLQLSYGAEATLDIHSSATGSTVAFAIPATRNEQALPQETGTRA